MERMEDMGVKGTTRDLEWYESAASGILATPMDPDDPAEAVGRCAVLAAGGKEQEPRSDEVTLAEGREEALALIEQEADDLQDTLLVADGMDLGPDPIRGLHAAVRERREDVSVVDVAGDLVTRLGYEEVALRSGDPEMGFEEAEPLEPAYMLGIVDARRAPEGDADDWGHRMIKALDGIGDEGRAALLGYAMGLGNPSLEEQVRAVAYGEPVAATPERMAPPETGGMEEERTGGESR